MDDDANTGYTTLVVVTAECWPGLHVKSLASFPGFTIVRKLAARLLPTLYGCPRTSSQNSRASKRQVSENTRQNIQAPIQEFPHCGAALPFKPRFVVCWSDGKLQPERSHDRTTVPNSGLPSAISARDKHSPARDLCVPGGPGST